MTGLVPVTSAAEVARLIADLRALDDLDALSEARARVKALRELHAARKTLTQVRLDLLRAEVEVLVRIVEVGGDRTLSGSWERKAARWLAEQTPEERARLVSEAGATITQAVGMCRAVWAAQESARTAHLLGLRGREYATSPEPPADDHEAVDNLRGHVIGVQAAIADLIDLMFDDDPDGPQPPLTIAEFAEEVVAWAGLPTKVVADPAVMAGVREVCRTAFRRQPVVMVDGMPLPRFVAALTEAGYVRVPIENALVLHYRQMVEQREEGARQQTAAAARYRANLDRLVTLAGGDEQARIGDVIARALLGDDDKGDD